MSLHQEARRILRAYGVTPRKRLGQNFLVDDEALGKLVSYAFLSADDLVLEVGAGLGFLTERLADVADRVLAVEIDSSLVRALRNRLEGRRNVTVLHGDIMKITVPHFDKVVSTPPYSISSALLFWLLDRFFKLAVLTFQEEFARRLAAPVGSEHYGRLTVASYCRSEVELLDRIPHRCFQPAPSVDSMIVRLRPRRIPFHIEDEKLFFEIVRVIFTQKNKKLRNAIMPFFGNLKIQKTDAVRLADSLPFHYRRPRELAPEEIGLTVNEIAKTIDKLGLR